MVVDVAEEDVAVEFVHETEDEDGEAMANAAFWEDWEEQVVE